MTPERLISGLLDATRVLRGILADHFAAAGLTDIRFEVLSRLKAAGTAGISQHQLATSISQAESSVSTLIDRMRRDGLVFRCTDQADRRKRLLILSPKGESLLAGIAESHTRLLDDLTCHLSGEQAASLASIITLSKAHWKLVSLKPAEQPAPVVVPIADAA